MSFRTRLTLARRGARCASRSSRRVGDRVRRRAQRAPRRGRRDAAARARRAGRRPATRSATGLRAVLDSARPVRRRAGTSQVVPQTAGRSAARGRRSRCPSPRAREAARASDEPFFSDARVDGHALRVLHGPARPRLRTPGRALARRGRHARSTGSAAPARWSRSSGSRSPPGSGSLVARAALAPVQRLTRRRGRVARPATSRGGSTRAAATSWPPRRDASTRCSPRWRSRARAAPARRRRVARAADAADEPAHEHRGARARRGAAGRRARAAAARRRSSSWRDDGARSPSWSSSRAATRRPPSRRTSGSTSSTAEAVERARRNRPGCRVQARARGVVVRGVPPTIERAVANLLDNAAKWSPPGGEVEVRVRDGEVDGARPRARDRPRRPAVRLRPLLPGAGGARACPARGSASRSCGRSRSRTAAPSPPSAAEGGGTRMRLTLPPDAAS